MTEQVIINRHDRVSIIVVFFFLRASSLLYLIKLYGLTAVCAMANSNISTGVLGAASLRTVTQDKT